MPKALPAEGLAHSLLNGATSNRYEGPKPIYFTVTDGHMSAFSISFALTGPDCNITDFTTNSTRDPQIAITDGQFSLPPAGSPLFEGRFNSPTEASGTGHTEPPPEKTPGCVAVDITWEAHR